MPINFEYGPAHMSVDCSYATSIFELGFAVNAVIALLGREREAAVKTLTEQLRRHIAGVDPKAASLWPTFAPVAATALLRVFPSFLPFFLFAGLVRVFAGAMTAISLATLLQGALWESACKLTSVSLIAYVLVAFVLAPLLYTWTTWGFRRMADGDVNFNEEEMSNLISRITNKRIS
jgi:hypothetical protein